MSDLLALLDQAIDGLGSVASSRYSRSGTHTERPTGQPKSLETRAVPAVPAIPAQKSELHGTDARTHEISRLNLIPKMSEAHPSTIQKGMGITVTTGTGPKNQRLTVPGASFEIGNNGNGSTESPPDVFDGYMRAAMQRPVSWVNPAARPSPGAFCSCCKGNRWWGDTRGWRCWTCHPPSGLAESEFVEVRT